MPTKLIMITTGKTMKKLTFICSVVYIVLLSVTSSIAVAHDHKKMSMKMADKSPVKCQYEQIVCAKTMTTAFAPNGDLWRVWSVNQHIYFQVSKDVGKSFGSEHLVDIPAEKISARNENRPKIGFDNNNGVYLSWAKSGKKRFTGDIRFSYSANGGKTFTAPITVNNDNLITGHSFNEMMVNAAGDVTIVWLDSRYSYQQKLAGNSVNGSDLYLAKGNPSKIHSFKSNVFKKNALINSNVFSNEAIARGTCVCCRIAMEEDSKGNLSVFWRHIFGDNIREFALLTIDESKPALAQVKQISHDQWYIQGCPHQGGGISIDQNNRYHLVWYNQGDKGKGIFYAFSDNAGDKISQPIAIGNNERQAAHPHIKHTGNIVDIIWLEFDGKVHQLWHQQSVDRGETFQAANILAESSEGFDRPFIISQGTNRVVSWQRPNMGHWLGRL